MAAATSSRAAPITNRDRESNPREQALGQLLRGPCRRPRAPPVVRGKPRTSADGFRNADRMHRPEQRRTRRLCTHGPPRGRDLFERVLGAETKLVAAESGGRARPGRHRRAGARADTECRPSAKLRDFRDPTAPQAWPHVRCANAAPHAWRELPRAEHDANLWRDPRCRDEELRPESAPALAIVAGPGRSWPFWNKPHRARRSQREARDLRDDCTLKHDPR